MFHITRRSKSFLANPFILSRFHFSIFFQAENYFDTPLHSYPTMKCTIYIFFKKRTKLSTTAGIKSPLISESAIYLNIYSKANEIIL